MVEYHTLQFRNDAVGIADRNRITNDMARFGWRIQSEVVEKGNYDGKQACCFFAIFAPCVFLTRREASTITVTFVRETIERQLPVPSPPSKLPLPLPSLPVEQSPDDVELARDTFEWKSIPSAKTRANSDWTIIVVVVVGVLLVRRILIQLLK